MFSGKFLFVIVLIPVIALFIGCGAGGSCVNTADFKIPEVEPVDADGWENYKTPIVLNESTVKGLNPGNDSLEAAVVQFFASKVRGDSCFKKALPLDLEKYRTKNVLERIKDWKFTEVTVIGKNKRRGSSYWFRIEMKIVIDGDEDSGVDEGNVREIDGKWYVTKPPA